MLELYAHQKEAVEWMQTTERRQRIVPTQPHGGILAHTMGLGKTITMLSFILGQVPSRTLVVCPKSLLLQWESEARVIGCTPPHAHVTVYHGAARVLPPMIPGAHQLVITTFEIVRLESQRGRALHDLTWDRVVLDEAHRICEQSSKTTHAIRSLRAPNRWCITGTPFKNGINDLMALSRFLMVSPYCNIMWWKWYGNSLPKLREWRRMMLHLRDKTVLTLPPLHTHCFNITLDANELELDAQLREVTWKTQTDDVSAEAVDSGTNDQHELLRILRMRQAANHPLLLLSPVATKHQILNTSTPPGMCEACGVDKGVTSPTCSHARCVACHEEPVCAACVATRLRQDGEWLHSSKTRALWRYLNDVANIKTSETKVVLFSQWTTCLDLIGWLLEYEKIGYARYDGRVNTMEEREQVIAEFRSTPACQVLLTSLGAGGEGVNLTFASHVVLMEPYWNLAAEQQAIDRIHRIGQDKVTHVAHFYVQDSVETWVKSIQTRKINELQRLLYDNIITTDPSVSSVPPLKRTFTQRLRPQFDGHSDDSKDTECLVAFLVNPPKVAKVQ